MDGSECECWIIKGYGIGGVCQLCLNKIKAEKDQEIANAKMTIERDEALRTEYMREIAELKEEIKEKDACMQKVIDNIDKKLEESKETGGKQRKG